MSTTDDTSEKLARILMGQADRKEEQSAFWMVSAINKLTIQNPDMTLLQLKNMILQEMPTTWRKYHRYVETT